MQYFPYWYRDWIWTWIHVAWFTYEIRWPNRGFLKELMVESIVAGITTGVMD